MFRVLLLYFCFTGVMFLNSHLVVNNPVPFIASGGRMFIAGFMLLAMHLLQHRKRVYDHAKKIMCSQFLKYSICLYTIAASCFSWAVQYVDPVKACFLIVMSPFVTALMLYFLHGDRLSTKKFMGLGIGLTAVIPIVLSSNHGAFAKIPLILEMAGYLVFAIAVLSFAYGWILKKQLLSVVHDVPTPFLTGMALFVGGFTTLLLASFLPGPSMWSMQLTADFWPVMLLFSFLTAVSYGLYGSLLKQYSPTFLSFAGFLEPAFSLFYGAIFYGHPITMLALLSLVVLGMGLFIFYQEELKLG